MSYKKLNNIIDKTSDTFKISPHMLRHTFATHLLEKGADLRTIQEILGHTDVASTLMYTQMADMKLRDEYLKAHPRGN